MSPPPSSLTGSLWREKLHLQSQWFIHSFIHLYLSESPIRSPPTKNGENIWSLSTEPHVDRKPTYNGVRPSSPRGLFTTLRFLPQCHAAFGMIPSTLAWIDQSSVSQHVSWQPPTGYNLHNCYRLPRDPGQSRVRICDSPRYGRGVGFMGGVLDGSNQCKN
jgi:hypothetical protein